MMSSEQTGNGLGSGAPVQQNPMTQQGSPFSMSPPSMGGLDAMTLNTMSMGSVTSNSAPRQTTPSLNPMTTGGSLLESLAPKFPPQNFDVPDISYSNSVSPNEDFDQSLFSSVQAMAGARHLFASGTTASSGCMAPSQPMTTSQTGAGGVMTSMTSSNRMTMPDQAMMTSPSQPLTSFLPPVSSSPPGTGSSSEDSDDLPLAQIAMKRTAGLAVTCAPSGLATTLSSTTALTPMATGPTDSPVSTPDHAGPQTESSPLTASPPPGGKKTKASKRKKKKDPNEPQKPVSAYALFFRDTQATIKGHNPSASFGEVSKIVASMWDQLDPKHKEVYKKKTEAAKKLYLKQLAAYRASQVSQSAVDESDKSPSPPGVGLSPPGMGGNSAVMQNPGMIHPVTTAGPRGPIMPPHMPVNGPMMHMSPQVMQQQQQQQQQYMQQQQQLQMHHHHQQQMSALSPQNTMSPSPPASLQPQQQQQQQQHSSPQQHMSHLQTPPQQPQVPVAMYNSPPQGNGNGYHQSPVADPSTMGFVDQNMDVDMGYNRCTRNGCSNQVIENPAWDSEYCSNECVITHCRDVFSTWSAARSGSNTFPVK